MFRQVETFVDCSYRMGAEELPQMFKKKTSTPFQGTGYKLGEGGSDSSVAVGGNTEASEAQEVVLHLWSNGFSIDNGPLRSYQDPANLAFLDAVKRGEVPAELRQQLRGRECTVNIMDKRGQDFETPKSSAKAFSGEGYTLGSPAPKVVGSSSATDRQANETSARSQIQLTDGAPTTNIQFRLTDGSRLAAQFNHTHTVQDLYNFVNT